jgi:hypothetical protein
MAFPSPPARQLINDNNGHYSPFSVVLNKMLSWMYDDDQGKSIFSGEFLSRVSDQVTSVQAIKFAKQEKTIMSEKFDTQQVSFEDALQMQIYTSQALMDVLVDKGIVTYQEILARVEALKKEHHLEISGISGH